MDIATNILIAAVATCFLAGALITAISGKARPVKIVLAGLSGILFIALVAGVVFTRGLLIYLLFQVIILIILLDFVVIAGAVCGGGIYLLLHRKPTQALDANNLTDYQSVKEFAALEGVEEERLIARIKSGFCKGGRYGGEWYIHQSERSPEPQVTPGDAVEPLLSTNEVRKGKLRL